MQIKCPQPQLTRAFLAPTPGRRNGLVSNFSQVSLLDTGSVVQEQTPLLAKETDAKTTFHRHAAHLHLRLSTIAIHYSSLSFRNLHC